MKKKEEPQKEPFTREKVEPIEEREPFVDIFEDEDKVIVMAELPGVPEEDIEWEVVGDILTIKTSTPEKEYTKEIVLPKPVEKNQVESNYRHGILEIKLKKTTEDT